LMGNLTTFDFDFLCLCIFVLPVYFNLFQKFGAGALDFILIGDYIFIHHD